MAQAQLGTSLTPHSLGINRDLPESPHSIPTPQTPRYRRNTTESSTELSDNTITADTDDANEEADEEDEDGTVEDDDDETEDDAPLRKVRGVGQGPGRGKGKGPGIRVTTMTEHAKEDNTNLEEDGAGHIGTLGVPLGGNLKRKRRESNLSTASILEDDEQPSEYPRRKIRKDLKHSDGGLLTYANEQAIDDDVNDDSDGYEGVNNISNSDEEDADIEAHEEGLLMDSGPFDFSRRSSQSSLDSELVDHAISRSLMGHHEDPIEMSSIFKDDYNSPPGRLSKRKNSESSTKQVRFADEIEAWQDTPSSPSTSSSDFETLYPDLLSVMPQDALPVGLLEDDTDGDGFHAGSDSNDSFWDFEEGEASSRRSTNLESPQSDESGYETDSSTSGDTTDEEGPPPSSIVAAKSILHDPNAVTRNETASPTPFRRGQKQLPRKRKLPRLGNFKIDPTKAAAFADATGRNIIIKHATAPRPTNIFAPTNGVWNVPSNSQIGLSDSDGSDNAQALAASADIMLTGMFGFAGGAFNFGRDITGPPEAFYPWTSIDNNGVLISEDLDDEDLSPHSDFDLHDFMHLGDDDDDAADAGFEDIEGATTDAELNYPGIDSTPIAAGRAADDLPSSVVRERSRSIGEAMLEHFDQANVAAFRNNQINYHHIARQPADPDLRASASKPLRSGKTAETHITPVRRRRADSSNKRKSKDLESPLFRRSSSAVTKRVPPRMGAFA